MLQKYPSIRSAIAPSGSDLSNNEVEQLVAELFPGADPWDVEDFLGGLRRLGRQIAPVAQRALPGVVQGAVTGLSVGGPWGALAGAVGGGAMSALGGAGQAPRGPASRPAPRRPVTHRPPAARVGTSPGAPPTPAVAPAAAPAGAASSAFSGASSTEPRGVGAEPANPMPGPMTTQLIQSAAPAQLLALLARPETMQALTALALGQMGRSSVTAAGRTLPVTAIANALSELAASAAECAAPRHDFSDYYLDAVGAPRADWSNPSAWTQLLLADLLATPLSAEEETSDSYGEFDEEGHETDDASDDWDEEFPVAASSFGVEARIEILDDEAFEDEWNDSLEEEVEDDWEEHPIDVYESALWGVAAR